MAEWTPGDFQNPELIPAGLRSPDHDFNLGASGGVGARDTFL
jgi:hypothetical protein